MTATKMAKSFLLVGLLVSTSVSMARLVINEVMAITTDRVLVFDENDIPSLGPLSPWYSKDFDDSDWKSGQAPFGAKASFADWLSHPTSASGVHGPSFALPS